MLLRRHHCGNLYLEEEYYPCTFMNFSDSLCLQSGYSSSKFYLCLQCLFFWESYLCITTLATRYRLVICAVERLLASPLPKEISPFSKCYTHPVSNPHVTFIYCLVFLGCMYIPTNCQLLQRSDSVSSVSFKALLVKEQLSKMLNWLQLLP